MTRDRRIGGMDMNGWAASLAACAVLGELADALSPEGWREHLRRICAAAALVALLVPIAGFWRDREKIAGLADSFLTDPAAEAQTGREAWAGAAELVFETAEKIGIGTAEMTVVFMEEDRRLTGVRVVVPGTPYNLRAELEEELGAYFGVPAEVGTEEGRSA